MVPWHARMAWRRGRDAISAARNGRQAAISAGRPFRHGALHALDGGLLLADSYHCSRYNTNTGRLTTEMFEAVVRTLRERLK